MSTNVDLIKKYQKILLESDHPLDTTDAFYQPNLHGTNEQDVTQQLFDVIDVTPATGLFYFTGQKGTGKSTELLRLKGMLDASNYRCILFDSLHYLNDTHSITTEYLMLVIANGVNDWIGKAYPEIDFTKINVFSRFSSWLGTTVSLDKAQLTAGALKFDFKLKSSQSEVAEKIKNLKSRQQFHQNLVAFISEMCDWVKNREKRDVVLVVDSLERLRNPSFLQAGTEDIYVQVSRVFSDELEQLKIPNLKIVYSVPPYLCMLQNVQSRVKLFALASVRVYENPQNNRRKPRDSGLKTMRGLLTRRCPDWKQILKPEALDRLVLISGGDIRDFFVRILFDAFRRASYAADRLPLDKDDAVLNDIDDSFTTEMLQLTFRDNWPLLKRVGAENTAIANNEIELKTLAHLMEVKAILNYRNGCDWYDLHPTLWHEIGKIPPI